MILFRILSMLGFVFNRRVLEKTFSLPQCPTTRWWKTFLSLPSYRCFHSKSAIMLKSLYPVVQVIRLVKSWLVYCGYSCCPTIKLPLNYKKMINIFVSMPHHEIHYSSKSCDNTNQEFVFFCYNY